MKLFKQLKWFFKREWRKYISSMIILICISLLQLAPPKLVGLLIDNVIAGHSSKKNLFIWLGIMVLTAFLIYVLRYIWRVLLFGAAYQLAIELRYCLYNLLSKQMPGFYLFKRTGDLMARATNDVDRVVFAAGEGVLTLIDSLVMGGSVLMFMSFQISWQLTLLALLPMPIMAILIKRDGRCLHQRFHDAQASFSALNNQAQENLTNIRMIKAFGLEEYQSNRFENVAKKTSKKNMNVARVDARFEPTIYLSVGISNLIAVSGGSYLMLSNAITIGQLTSFIMYLGLMIWPMLAFAWMFNIVERGGAAYGRICQMLQEKQEIEDGKLFIPKKKGILVIKIKNFIYPNSKKKSLQNIFLKLKPGQMLGICGPTGAGKSTLLSLILRQFDVTEGEILFNNLPLNKIKLDQWRSRLAVVNQTPFLFSDNIINNISFGKPNASKSEIEKVARLACIHKDILRLPKGYKTEIGERGIMLSGGQKQRLAIARALLLESEILILDDALSAVDGSTEHNILYNLCRWSAKRTLIISAHRLSALQGANEILVLKYGKISQRGNHELLLQQKGWYKNMYSYQQLEGVLENEFNFIKEI